MQKFNTEDEKQQVREGLHKGLMTVHFTKKNGDDRVMTCTLKEDLIPSEQKPKTKETKEDTVEEKKEDLLCAVYDVNAKGWRSFAWERVKDVQYGIPSLDF